ncbi:MAG: glycerol-3-phosphate responsive antiterminator [Clostridiales bacterium]|nr:glycerol-3-phosphate responsive antiterminator [Clostridiales bacterium]
MSLTLSEFIEYSDSYPVIPSIKNEEWLREALKVENPVVYVIYGDICTIGSIVDTLRQAGKKVIVHIDLIVGLAPKEVSVDFIRQFTQADGIISSKPALIKRAKMLGLFTIQRYHIYDVMAYRNVEKLIKTSDPDIIEFMPAGLTKGIAYLMEGVQRPFTASGMILDKEDIINALNIGVVAVSTTNKSLWNC